MALVIKDRVLESSTTTGPGSFTLDGALVGYQSFFDAIGNTNTTYYCIEHQDNEEWEVGLGTVGTNSLTRDTILDSSNSGSAVNFSAGTKRVFVTMPGDRLFLSDRLLDEDDMASNSATDAPSQQSVKAYVDNNTITMPVSFFLSSF